MERIRCKCPVCGMVNGIENFKESKPYDIKVWVQEFGGKVAGETRGRGSAKGYMKYKNVTKGSQDIVRMIKTRVRAIAKGLPPT